MSTDPTSDPTTPEAASRIGSILASAERQVTEILADADRQAAELHAASARLLDERAAVLDEIAQGLAAAAADAERQLARLRGLEPLDLTRPGGPGTSGGAAATPDPGSPDGDRPAAPAPGAAASDGAGPAATPGDRAGDEAAGGTHAAASEILHRPQDWVGSRDGDGRADPGDDRVDGRGAKGDRDGLEPDGAEGDLPIIAESDGADYPEDPPEKVDSARLVALSMAANGRSREEVEAHVRDELGIVDHAALIEYVFGINAPSSIVPSWPPRRRRRG